MIQEIIVFIILSAVISYVVVSVVRKMRVKKTNACGGCTGCDLKKDLACKVTVRKD
jgi:large-conductance mechanosensitive channel